MSFGFGVSDLIYFSRLAWQIYEVVRTGPEACRSFAIEVLRFHNILERVAMTLEDELSELSVADTEFLDLMNLSCRQLLAEICEVQNLRDRRILLKDALFNPEIERTKTWTKLYGDFSEKDLPWDNEGYYRVKDCYYRVEDYYWVSTWHRRLRDALFTKKIPKFQSAIAAEIGKLTAFNVSLVQYCFLSYIQHQS